MCERRWVEYVSPEVCAMQLGLPVAWLQREARADRIPCLDCGGGRLRCDIGVVREALNARRSGELQPRTVEANSSIVGMVTKLASNVAAKLNVPVGELLRDIPRGDGRDSSAVPELLDKPISILTLSGRPRHCLAWMHITTVGELVQRAAADLLDYRGFGKTSLHEVQRKLTEHGLTLADEMDAKKASKDAHDEGTT